MLRGVGIHELNATDAALKYLQERRAQFSNVAGDSLGRVPIMESSVHLSSGLPSLSSGRKAKWSAAAPHQCSTELDEDDVSSVCRHATPWAVFAGQVSRAVNALSVKADGAQTQLEMERTVRESELRDLRASHANHMAEILAAVKQLKEENNFLKKSVRDLQSRNAWGHSEESPNATMEQADKMAWVRRLEDLEATVGQQQDRWSERVGRLQSSAAETIQHAVELELQRMRSLARETAQQATADLVRREVNAEREERERAVDRLEANLAKTSAAAQQQADRKVLALEQALSEQLNKVKGEMSGIQCTVDAATRSSDVLREVDVRWASFRQLVEQQLETLRHDLQRQQETSSDKAVEREQIVRREMDRMVKDHLLEHSQRFVTQADVTTLLDGAVGSLRQHFRCVQDGQQEVRGALNAQQRQMEETGERVNALSRSNERHQTSIEALENLSQEMKQAQQTEAEDIAALQKTVLRDTAPRVEGLMETVHRIIRERSEQDTEFRTQQRKVLDQLRQTSLTVEGQGSRLSQCNAQLEALADATAHSTVKCESLQSALEESCVAPLQALEKEIQRLSPQVSELSAKLRVQVSEVIPTMSAALRDEIAAQQKTVEQMVRGRMDAMQTILEGFNTEHTRRTQQLATAWERFREDTDVVTPAAVQQQVGVALEPHQKQCEDLKERMDQLEQSHRTDLSALQETLREREEAKDVEALKASQQDILERLQSIQRQFLELTAAQDEHDSRTQLLQEETALRLQKQLQAVTRLQLQVEQEKLSASLLDQVKGQVEAHVVQLRSELPQQVTAELERELYAERAPLRLVTRLMESESCRHALVTGLQPDLRVAEPSSALPVPSSAMEALLVEEVQRRLSHLETWLGEASQAQKECLRRLDESVAQHTTLAATVTGMKRAEREGQQADDGTLEAHRAALSAVQTRLAQLESSFRTGFEPVETRVGVLEQQCDTAVRAQAAALAARQQEGFAALTGEMELMVQPVSLQVKGLVDRHRQLVEQLSANEENTDKRFQELSEKMVASEKKAEQREREHIAALEDKWSGFQQRLDAEHALRTAHYDKTEVNQQLQCLKEELLLEVQQTRDCCVERESSSNSGSMVPTAVFEQHAAALQEVLRRVDGLEKNINAIAATSSSSAEEAPSELPHPGMWENRLQQTEQSVSALVVEWESLQRSVDSLREQVATAQQVPVAMDTCTAELSSHEHSRSDSEPLLASALEEKIAEMDSRLASLEEMAESLQESGDMSLTATTEVLVDLQRSLQQCVELVQREFASPEWQAVLQVESDNEDEKNDGTTRAVQGLDDVFIHVLRYLCKAHTDIHTLHRSLCTILDLVQQHEIDAVTGAEEISAADAESSSTEE